METKQLAPGVRVHYIQDEKFKRTRIAMHFVVPSQKEDATCMALLPMVLERGYADCPDMTELSLRLAQLYGADLALDTAVTGKNRTVSVSVTGIKDRYALQGEALTRSYMEILLGVALRPVLENGAFLPEEVEIEKQKLKELIASEINNKRARCIRQAQRRFFEGEQDLGVERYGYLEEVDAITPQRLYEAYQKLLSLARIEIFAIGCDPVMLEQAFHTGFDLQGRAPVPPAGPVALAPGQLRRFEEPVDAVQGKLCLLFTTGAVLPPEQRGVMRVAMAVFGSSPTSRLFMNVREKLSLCYYCAAQFSSQCSYVQVDSGVEHENAQKTIDAILSELRSLVEGGPTQEELAAAKKALINALSSVRDSLPSIESWYLNEQVFGTGKSPEQVIREIEAVTDEQVQEMLGRLSLSVEYLLTEKEK